jgi:hypothetical protein
MNLANKFTFLFLVIFLSILIPSCLVNKGPYYKGDEYKNTYIDFKAKTLYFGASIKNDFFVTLTGDTIEMTVYMKARRPITSFKLPDVMHEYGKYKEIEYRVIQSKGVKVLYSYKIGKSDWLDSITKKKGVVYPF